MQPYSGVELQTNNKHQHLFHNLLKKIKKTSKKERINFWTFASKKFEKVDIF